jgi:hypothetical protein
MSLDKLYLGSDCDLSKEGIELLRSHGKPLRADQNYSEAFIVSLNGARVVVKSSPRFSYGKASETRLELNPSHFKSWNSCLASIEKLLDPSSCFIKRIDHATDLPMPITQVHQCVRVKFKKGSQLYCENRMSGEITGMYFGKNPELHCYYDKAYELSGKLKTKRIPGSEVGVVTRFEVRHQKKKVLHPRLLDLKNYLNTNPYENVQFLEVDPGMAQKKAEAIRTLVAQDGLSTLHHNLNRNHNAMRTLKGMKERDLGAELYEVYQENLRHFFNDKPPPINETNPMMMAKSVNSKNLQRRS